MRPAFGTPEGAEPVFSSSCSNGVSILSAEADSIHNALRETVTLAVASLALSRQEVAEGTSDHTPNVTEHVHFGGRFHTQGHLSSLALQLAKQ